MDKVHEIPRELEWRGYDNFTLFRDTDAKIALRKAQLADLPRNDDTLITRTKHVYALAGLYWAKHEHDEALEYFQQAIRLTERLKDTRFQSWCYNGLGDVYEDMGRSDEAIAAYQCALAFNATSAYSYMSLGCMYGELLNHPEDAITAYQRALELSGLNAHLVSIVHCGLGSAHHSLGNEEAAITAYQRAVEADPGFLSPHDNLSIIAMKRHEFPTHRCHFEELIRLRPQHSSGAYVSLGIMARHQGDPESATYFHRGLESFDAACKGAVRHASRLSREKGAGLDRSGSPRRGAEHFA